MKLERFLLDARKGWALEPGQEGWVTVVVPTYNRADLVTETLDSVLAQNYRPIELLVVDDGSSDETVRVVQDWIDNGRLDSDFEVRIIEQENAGAPVARNRGVRESSGEFIQFLDSDDTLDPEKLRIQVDALVHDSGVDFAYGRVYDLETRRRMIYGHSEMSPKRMILKQVVNPAFTTLGPLCRRTMLEQLGPWDEQLPMCQDWEYHSRAAVLGFRGVFTPTACALVRQNSGQRLSWRFEPKRAPAWHFARSRHLASMWFHASHELSNDREFRSALAWEFVLINARAMKLGCQIDDVPNYAAAAKLSRAGVLIDLPTIAYWTRVAAGATLGTYLILGVAWLYNRVSGLRYRLKSVTRWLRSPQSFRAMHH